MTSKKLLLTAMIVIQFVTNAFTQALPAKTITRIDSLFANWTTNRSPGCSIGIVRNDTLIYSKGYGLANLEYHVANTPETIFHHLLNENWWMSHLTMLRDSKSHITGFEVNAFGVKHLKFNKINNEHE
ncbi:hypothetical protein [Dyadobacter psychrophilus]|uniref:Beta-lactamase n=1 Tax=Dyadobacter psychrophilus TaxID=651661 RepID=A0A1T5ESB4_9BACT|nr:hypothetical protein [Dyadobacter psychrophilus]SKB86851.1 hypothetical protein SAMN05660293_02730 [Dyadobacter psychrophilus]